MLGSNNNQRNMEYSRGSKTPSKSNTSIYCQKSPRASQGGNYRNDVSPFRGRFGSNVRPSKTPERQNRSPLRKEMKINSRFEKENTGFSRPTFTDNKRTQMQPQRQNLSPLMRR